MAVALTILSYLGFALFGIVLLLGILATLVGLPGTVLILANAVIFSAIHGFDKPPWPVLVILLTISIVAETADNIFSALGTKTGGGSNRTSLWALIGGVAGAIVGANFSAILGALGLAGGVAGIIFGVVLPPLLLAMAGGFLAAYVYELRTGKESVEARKAGWGALVGRLAGVLSKAVLATIMVAIILVSIF